VARSARGPVLVVLALIVTAFALAAYVGTGSQDPLDPDAYTPDGAHAITALLHDRNVQVLRVDTAQAVQSRRSSTVFVPIAQALTPGELRLLAGRPGRLVVVGASGPRDRVRRLRRGRGGCRHPRPGLHTAGGGARR
jgi:hypothetical protein